MSIAGRCPSCLMGKHAGHDRDFRIMPGLIGGQYCDCQGDCAAEFKAEGERIREELGLVP